MNGSNSFGTCRYCGKQIMWIRTKAGKNMPVDPAMINYRRSVNGDRAKEKIVTPQGEVLSADRTSNREAEGYGYIPHFSTCNKRNV